MGDSYINKEIFGTEISRVEINPEGYWIRLRFSVMDISPPTLNSVRTLEVELRIERDSAAKIMMTLSSYLIGYEKEAKKTKWLDGDIAYEIDLINHQTYLTIQQADKPWVKLRLSRPRMLWMISSLANSYRVNRGEEL